MRNIIQSPTDFDSKIGRFTESVPRTIIIVDRQSIN